MTVPPPLALVLRTTTTTALRVAVASGRLSAALPSSRHSPLQRSLSTASAAATAPSSRRRRRPGRLRGGSAAALDAAVVVPGGDSSSSPDSSASSEDLLRRHAADGGEPYAPTTPDGELMPMDEYLKMASLSPWVPAPDPVARRMLEIAQAGPDDVHVDLGSGDGRLNFHAIDPPHSVQRTTGIDVDDALVRRASNRLNKRHPRPGNVNFLRADLLAAAAAENGPSAGSEKEIEAVRDVLSGATVVTMYFVSDALQKIRPLLERELGGNRDRGKCRVVTCGYAMDGWQPDWVEVILGLPLYLYNVGGGNVDDDGDGDGGIPSPGRQGPTLGLGGRAPSPRRADSSTGGAVRLAGDNELGEDLAPFMDKDFVPTEPDRLYEESDRVDFGWDDFDEADRIMEEKEGKGEELGGKINRGGKK